MPLLSSQRGFFTSNSDVRYDTVIGDTSVCLLSGRLCLLRLSRANRRPSACLGEGGPGLFLGGGLSISATRIRRLGLGFAAGFVIRILSTTRNTGCTVKVVVKT
jgi:hypothetical protein